MASGVSQQKKGKLVMKENKKRQISIIVGLAMTITILFYILYIFEFNFDSFVKSQKLTAEYAETAEVKG